MSEELVSVGIPAHDNASTIGETITSLRRQTYESWRCVISCDTESTATYDVARAAVGDDSRFSLKRAPANQGVAANWNNVLGDATGSLFKLLCADDVLYPKALELQRAALLGHPSAVLCTGRRTVIGASGRTIQKSRGLRGPRGPLSLDDVITLVLKSGTNPLGEPSFALYRTGALRSGGGFSTTWQYTIDLASYIQVLTLGELVSVDAEVGQFRISPTSWSSALAKQQSREMLEFLDYALSMSASDVRGFDLALGRTTVRTKSLLRQLVSKVSGRRKRVG